MYLAYCMLLMVAVECMAAGEPGPADTYRVLVSTDLGGDPDDIQSLYRLVHYSDILRVEGIVSSPGPGAKNSAALIKHWIRRIDADHLRGQGHPGLMSEADLLVRVKQGAYRPGGPGPARVTEGSQLIVERANANDPEARGRPLWVLVWGSMTDVAQALHDDPGIAARIRIYSIGSNNTRADQASREFVFQGLQTRWPVLWWIENGTLPLLRFDTFRGVYQGGDQTGEWGNVEFVRANIRGRGTNHGGEFDEIAGDAFPLAGPRDAKSGLLKEGDSPAMLYLLSPALGGPGRTDDPTAESWGGQFRRYDRERFPNYYVDLDLPTDRECWTSVNKWRVAFLSDWKKRWQWYGVSRPPRLKVSRDGRRLETEEGKPFVWVGDTAWHLFMHLDRDEAARYLQDRKAKKFTVIQAHLLGFDIGEMNAYGERAFVDNDVSRPNEAYFRRAVSVIDRAAGLGLYVLVLPAWARMHVETKSPALATAAAAEGYGLYVGRLLKDRTNVIWGLGGDVRPARHEIYDALARGIAAGMERDPLMSYHPPGGTNRPPATSTGEFYHDKAWLDFNMIQSGHRRGNENYRRIAEDYARSPAKPTVDGEPCYEQHPIRHSFANGAFEAADLRQRAYWSILAGAFGFTYGGNGIWQMARPERPGSTSHLNFYWDAALDLEGAGQMRFVHEILERFPERVPDSSMLGENAGTGLDHLEAARIPGSGEWLVYTANGRTFELKLPAGEGRAWWFNPRNGRKTAAAWQPVFDPPGEAGFGNDWLLIVEAAR